MTAILYLGGAMSSVPVKALVFPALSAATASREQADVRRLDMVGDISVLQPSRVTHAKLYRFPQILLGLCAAFEWTERDLAYPTITAQTRETIVDMKGQTNGQSRRGEPDDSDVEEEGMANEYIEQVQYDDDGYGDDDMGGYAASQPDIQSQLQAAVTPLERGAGLDLKMASYDNYVSLFHYILNSDGPVELDLPSVCKPNTQASDCRLTLTSSPGPGT